MSMLSVHPDTGELVRSGGSFGRVGGLDEVAQHNRIRLRLFRGECPFDLSRGMRYVGLVLAKGTPPERSEGEFVEQILGTPGVVSVDEITLEVDGSTRVASVDYAATVSVEDARQRIPLHDRFTVALGA